MTDLKLPFSEDQLRAIIAEHPTPFHLYDEAGMRATAQKLNGAFDWSKGELNGQNYINHFAVKATPNPHLMKILSDEAMGTDASSGPELQLSKAVGLNGEKVIFTANNVTPDEYREAHQLRAVINLDDLNQIDVMVEAIGEMPEQISFRYNPGPDRVTDESNVIGNPEDAKFGISTEQLKPAYTRAKELGAKRFGLHTMVVSNELDVTAHIQTAEMLFEKVAELSEALDIQFEFVNLGGGIGPGYKPEDQAVDLEALSSGVKEAHQRMILDKGLSALQIRTENGRFVMAPNGYLITTVRSLKETYHKYVGLDATMADLMRPGMYDSYHHITVLGKEDSPRAMQRVTGSLCENNDYFTGEATKERELPVMEPGDIVVIHTTGAHGHSMGFNYNGKMRHAELLLGTDGKVQEIRRAETRADLFKTLDFPGLN